MNDPFSDPDLVRPAVRSLVTCLLWLGWLWLLYAIIAEIVRRLRRLRPPQVSAGGFVQTVAGSVVGAVTVGLTSTTVVAPASTPPPLVATLPDHDVEVVPLSSAVPTDAVRRAVEAGGIGLPNGGGWIDAELAAAVVSASALVWLQRRYSYRPRPPATAARVDPDLAPERGTVRAIRRAAAPGASDDEPTATADLSVPYVPVIPVIPVVRLDAGLVGIHGPGALDAVRGMIVAAVLDAAHGEVLCTAGVWNHLVGVESLTSITIVDSTHTLVAALEQRVLDRVNTHEADSNHPPLLAVVDHAGPEHSRHLAITAALGASVAIRGVVVLSDSIPQSWHVTADGAVRSRSGAEPLGRISVLSRSATRDILSLSTTRAHVDPPKAPVPAATVDAWPTVAAEHRRSLRLRILGEPVLYGADRVTEVHFPRRAALEILVLLAIRPLPSNELMEHLWPDIGLKHATGRLHTNLHALRTVLRQHAGRDVLDHRDVYRLDPDLITVDLWRFRAAIQAAANSPDDRRHLEAAIGCYQGELAAGQSWNWVDQHRESTRRTALDACVALAAHEDDPAAAMRVVEIGLDIDPLNEALYRQAIRLHAQRGDPDMVLACLAALKRNLAAAGGEPSAETRNLVDRVLRLDPPVR